MDVRVQSDTRTVLANVRIPAAASDDPASGALKACDILLDKGLIADIAPPGTLRAPRTEACDNGIVLPCFVDLHTHLDKGHIWGRQENPDGSWEGALQAVGADRAAHWSGADVARRMDFSIRSAYAHGTAAIRTHLDSGPPQHDITWDIFETARHKWAGRVELQAVALIGPDIMLDSQMLDAVASRAKAGGGILGGSVAVHEQAREAVLAVVEKAGELGLDLDLHCDETGDPEASGLLHLAEAVLETGYKGSVVAGHCCALAVQDDDTARATIDAVVEAGITIVSLPMCNMYLQDRGTGNLPFTPRWRGVTPLRELRAAGARVAVASDNTRDPFYAYGDLDGLEVLRESARILHFDHPQDDAFTWVRAVGADAAAAAGFGYTATIGVGQPADFVVFRGRNWTELMARPQSDRQIYRNGEKITSELPDYRELDDLMGMQ